MWYGSVWPEGAITRLNVCLDGSVPVGMRRGGACGVGRCIRGMMGICILGGVGAYGTLGGGGAVGTLGSGGEFGTLGSGGSLGTGTLGGGAGRPDQRFIGGMVGIAGVGAGRDNCIIFDNCIRACVCSMPNFAVGDAGCGCWRAATSSWIERVMFSCGERPGRTWSLGKKQIVSPWRTWRVLGYQMPKQW